MAFDLDASAFPLVLVRWTGCATAEIFESFFDAHDALRERARTHASALVTIHDARLALPPDAAARDVATARVGRTRVMPGVMDIVVTDHPGVRGVITALGWVLPGPMKNVMTAPDLATAYQLARTAFAAHKQPAPEPPPWAKGGPPAL